MQNFPDHRISFLLNLVTFHALLFAVWNKPSRPRRKQEASAFASYKVLTDVNTRTNLLTSGESVPTKLHRSFFAKGRFEIGNKIAVWFGHLLLLICLLFSSVIPSLELVWARISGAWAYTRRFVFYGSMRFSRLSRCRYRR